MILMVNVGLFSQRFPDAEARSLLELTNITHDEAMTAYTLGGMRFSLLLLSVVPGLMVLTGAVAMTGHAGRPMGSIVYFPERFGTVVLLLVQIIPIIAMLQFIGLHTYADIQARLNKTLGLSIAAVLLILCSGFAALMLKSSSGGVVHTTLLIARNRLS